jgi:hypothetical protein
MAETRRGDLNQYLASSWRIELDLVDGEGFGQGIGGLNTHAVEHRSLDLHPSSPR